MSGWLIFNELRGRKFKGAASAAAVLSPAEIGALQEFDARVAALDAEMLDLQAQGVRAGYGRRNDGWFDGRRVEARELNLQLGHLAESRAQVSADAEGLRSALAVRMESWLAARSGLVGARSGLIAFIVVFFWVSTSSGGVRERQTCCSGTLEVAPTAWSPAFWLPLQRRL
uniref:Uncharacterized protein n=1 Tax=Phenylobacterium glaciei TaxID=2803784 RepID=A0A974P1R7_9CAUL|nr:hypothetical protein JKL49_16575 [Phenylobacterium glaciei]